MAWGLKRIIILAVILEGLVIGGVVGTVLLVDALRDALKQPEIFVRSANLSLVDCGLLVQSQFVQVTSFRLANVGEVAGNINIQVLVDGQPVWNRDFLVLPGDDGTFPVGEVVTIPGCDAQTVNFRIASTWRA